MIDNHTWKQFSRDQARRERLRYIRLGVIVPACFMQPTSLVKTEEGWVIP